MNFDHFKSQVANNKIIVDELWYKKCSAINIQFKFNEYEQGKFNELQFEILNKTGESLLTCPAEALHISLAFILNVKDNSHQNKDHIWKEIQTECIENLRNIANKQKTIKIEFKQLIATNNAVIAVAFDNTEVQNLRSKIKQIEPIKKLTANESNIVHTTLFRYKRKLLEPKSFQKKLDTCKVNIPVTIQEFKIIKELRYPSVETETIGTFEFENNK